MYENMKCLEYFNPFFPLAPWTPQRVCLGPGSASVSSQLGSQYIALSVYARIDISSRYEGTSAVHFIHVLRCLKPLCDDRNGLLTETSACWKTFLLHFIFPEIYFLLRQHQELNR